MKTSVVYHKYKTGLLLGRNDNSDDLQVYIDDRVVSLTPQEAAHMAAAILNSYGHDRVS